MDTILLNMLQHTRLDNKETVWPQKKYIVDVEKNHTIEELANSTDPKRELGKSERERKQKGQKEHHYYRVGRKT